MVNSIVCCSGTLDEPQRARETGLFQFLTIKGPWQAGRFLCGEVKTLTCITKASFNNYKFAA